MGKTSVSTNTANYIDINPQTTVNTYIDTPDVFTNFSPEINVKSPDVFTNFSPEINVKSPDVFTNFSPEIYNIIDTNTISDALRSSTSLFSDATRSQSNLITEAINTQSSLFADTLENINAENIKLEKQKLDKDATEKAEQQQKEQEANLLNEEQRKKILKASILLAFAYFVFKGVLKK